MKSLTFEGFCEQERVLIRVNLLVLSGLFFIHLWHFSIDGDPEIALLVAFSLRFMWQLGDLATLRRWSHAPPGIAPEVLGRVSIVLHMAFAWGVTLFGDEERSHYIVIMALPVAAAGFRFGWHGILAVWLMAASHAFFEVWFYRITHPPMVMVEFFEAATIGLLYLVVGVSTYVLARQLRDRERKLEQSMNELAAARETLVAQESQAAIGRLARAVAHEVRNPVTMISSSIALFHEKQGVAADALELLSLVEIEARRLEKLTKDFLDYARERTLEFQDADARDAVELAVSLTQAQATLKGVALQAHVPPGPMPCRIDPFAVQQVLLNLLLNALEASPRDASVRAAVGSLPPRLIVFSVVNEGGPIPPRIIHHLFEPFHTTKPHGSGLGLATSRAIARAHGGDLRLGSNTASAVQFDLVLPRDAAGRLT